MMSQKYVPVNFSVRLFGVALYILELNGGMYDKRPG